MNMVLRTMQQIRSALLVRIQALQEGELLTLVSMKDYHGVSKSRFPVEWLERTLSEFGLTAADVQAELVLVMSDLRHEVHVHHEANAAVVMLGSNEHLPEPIKALAYLNDHWFSVGAGDEVDIPAETEHGFTVKEGGSAYFLSVQSPPIEREDGHDDYVLVST